MPSLIYLRRFRPVGCAPRGENVQSSSHFHRIERRRLFLMRHGDVAYFDEHGRPRPPDSVSLTVAGRRQAAAAGDLLRELKLDRIVTSGLLRTLETATIVAERADSSTPIEVSPELREIQGGRLRDIPDTELETEFLAAFRGMASEDARFLRGESIGELLDRVLPALDRLLADSSWDTSLLVLHGGVNRAIISRALLAGRGFLGNIAQDPGCINVLDVGDDWIVRAVNVAPLDLVQTRTRLTTMEELLDQCLIYRKRS